MNADHPQSSNERPELSFVIAVYNSGGTVPALVQRIRDNCVALKYQIVLVNDGSEDDSESVCANLAEEFSENLTFVQLSRNFGEPNALLAGLAHASGKYVAVIHYDGQPGPEIILSMLEEAKAKSFDVVYGQYVNGERGWLRSIMSRFNNRLASAMLQKPSNIHLSSFKVMNRFIVDEIIRYRGPFPHLDGLIYRSTWRIGQISIGGNQANRPTCPHERRRRMGLWLNMFLNFSITPLRISVYFGLAASAFSVLALALIWIDKIYFTKDLTPGIRTVVGIISLFSGIQLILLGLMGEYLGRLYLDHTGMPQFIARYFVSARTSMPPLKDKSSHTGLEHFLREGSTKIAKRRQEALRR